MARSFDVEKLTPVWCSQCQMWVPLEYEPHVLPEFPVPHYADGFLNEKEQRKLLARWRAEERRGA